MEDTQEDEKIVNFHDMELDDRILKAIATLRWLQPTLIQEKAIPMLLEGKDVLLRARTGSGKTAAFAIPIIQKVLNAKQMSKTQEVKAVVLAPTRELCTQIHKHFLDLTVKCSREVNCVDISSQIEIEAQRPLLISYPDVVISTPSRLLAHLKAKNLKIKTSLEILVIDEADLIFSFGYEDEIKEVVSYFPSACQASLASATLSEDVVSLKKLFLHNPVTLKLKEPELAPSSQLTHYILSAEEEEKATILYSLLKLHLIKGKTIVFVNTVDKCYKLKLFLEQFRIPTCVLNSELPANVRCHTVSQFNEGIYDIIIASDELALETLMEQKTQNKEQKSQNKKSKRKKDKESGVARGIDFQCVSNVLNFDFPLDVSAYVHRAGRTARGNNKGSALSFVSIRERPLMEKVEHTLHHSSGDRKLFKTYEFNMEEVESFRYRAKDAWRAVTRIAVREARLKEIKQEIFNSQTLKGYFVDNPQDYKTLRHDKALHTVKVHEHLSDVPEYIIPESLKSLSSISRPRKRPYPRNSFNTRRNRFQNQAAVNNPLLSLSFSGFKKKKKKE